MDIISEFIFEIVLEGIFGLTVENPNLKTWIKTTVFIVVSQFFTAVLVWMAIDVWRSDNNGWIIYTVIAAAWGIGTLIAAVYGHKRKWIQEH